MSWSTEGAGARGVETVASRGTNCLSPSLFGDGFVLRPSLVGYAHRTRWSRTIVVAVVVVCTTRWMDGWVGESVCASVLQYCDNHS